MEGEEAMAVKLVAVRKVSSFVMSKPRTPRFPVVPTICEFMYEVLMEFHRLKDACSAVVAAATVRTGVFGGRGFGIGSSVLFIRYLTGMQRESQKMRTTLALI